MNEQIPESTPLDDLEPGRAYHVTLVNGSFIKGAFDGFERRRGQPLGLRFPKGREVYIVPANRIARIVPI